MCIAGKCMSERINNKKIRMITEDKNLAHVFLYFLSIFSPFLGISSLIEILYSLYDPVSYILLFLHFSLDSFHFFVVPFVKTVIVTRIILTLQKTILIFFSNYTLKGLLVSVLLLNK